METMFDPQQYAWLIEGFSSVLYHDYRQSKFVSSKHLTDIQLSIF
jgi:hypothetical protein